MDKKIFVISNSHIDPVWIWRRRSGRTSWLNTMHSVTRLMAAHPEMKFTCSAAALYRWVEECDPELFRRIGKLVEAGRWEITGGWEVQSDTIIAETEPLLRQAESAKAYFREKFGVEIDTAYSVDAFGHGAGLPKILRASGFSKYVFLRPMESCYRLPLLFNWQADNGDTVTALRVKDTYNASNVSKEWYLNRIAEHLEQGLPVQTLFFGVGDHGGGISETHLEWLREAEEKFGVEMHFATLAEYFEAAKKLEIPTVKGELGKMFRGCYSACHEVKRQVAEANQRILTAEKLGVAAPELAEPWKELLFNHFHDILPGTSIMEAYRKDVYPGLGMVQHAANTLIDRDLCRRAAAEDTSWMPEGGVMVRNPEVRPATAVVSVTGFSDPNEHGTRFNTFVTRDGKEIPMQELPPPTNFGPCGAPWSTMTAVVALPPSGELFLAYAVRQVQRKNPGFARQREMLKHLSFPMFHDDSATWGFTMGSFLHVEDEAKLVSVTEFADGPVASVLRAEYRLRSSKIRCDLWCYAGIPDVKIDLKLDWFEERACLKIAYDHGIDDHSFYTGAAAASVLRFANGAPKRDNFAPGAPWSGNPAVCPEVPMVHWCAAAGSREGSGTAAFFSADLHSCDHCDGKMRLTLLRTTLFADHIPFPANTQTGYQDIGTSFIELWFADDPALKIEELPQRAHSRLNNAETLEVTCHAPSAQAICACPRPPAVKLPDTVVIDSLRLLENGHWRLHLTNYGEAVAVTLPGAGQVTLAARSLASFEIYG